MGRSEPTNAVSKSKSSTNPDRKNPEKGSTMRSRRTINRLNMYKNFKAKRNAQGKIISPAPFQSQLAPGTMARVEPNRRWFGNTRVISQDALQSFKEIMKIRNPYEVVLRKTKLPVSLLNEKQQKQKSHLLANESYSHVFGKKAQRKRPKLATDNIEEFASNANKKLADYDHIKDRDIEIDNGGVRDLTSDPHFKAGQSKRIWNELFKVVDSSDVVLYVLDARDPLGTRSTYIEKYLKERPHKHFILVLNKVDLVPVWVTKQWKTILSREYPTLVFHADIKKPLGKSALIGLLRQFSRFHSKDRTQISVGIIGYPNVGKSSIINTLKSKKVCSVAPIAGETKVWQYITLMKSIYLIDCPGVVYPQGDTESQLVLKGVVRVEYLESPEVYIQDVMDKVNWQYFQRRYNLNKLPSQGQQSDDPVQNDDEEEADANATGELIDWTENSEVFLETVARSMGRLLKGGEPDIDTMAKKILNDFQRGYLPYFNKPTLTPKEEEEFKSLGMFPSEKSDQKAETTKALEDSTITQAEEEKDESSEEEDEEESDEDDSDETSSSDNDDKEDRLIDLGIEMGHPIVNAVDDVPDKKKQKKVKKNKSDNGEEEDEDEKISLERKRFEKQLRKIKNKIVQSNGNRKKSRMVQNFTKNKKK